MDIDLRWGGDPNIIIGVETALVASIPIQPKLRIDYTLKAVGGSLAALPGISDMIEDTVNAIVTDTLQWPHRIVVPIGGPVDTRITWNLRLKTDLELKPQGKLTVSVMKANDLKNKEMIGKSDPYAVIHIRPVLKLKTKVIDDNLNPIWNETFYLIAEDKETQSLIIEVFNKDIGQDKKLGVAKLPLIDLIPDTPKEVVLKLALLLDMTRTKDKKDRGTITLKVLFHPFTKEEQNEALEEEKKLMEEKKKMKEAGMIGSTMDAVGSGVGMVGSGIGSGVGLVGSGFGAMGSGLSKAGRFMGRTITGHSGSRRSGSTTVNLVPENGS